MLKGEDLRVEERRPSCWRESLCVGGRAIVLKRDGLRVKERAFVLKRDGLRVGERESSC